jgi:glycosyltransferase involved in cell wall biosynthesis
MSSHLEGLGTIVADALAARRAVVATDAGGIPEIVEDGADALVVPAKDSKALAAAINRLLGDPDLRLRLGEAGRKKVEQRFSVTSMTDGNLAVYRELEAEAEGRG